MIDGLKPYPKLKDSGVPWLGEVPEHWEARRLKYIFRRIVGGSTPSSAEATYWDGDIVWATPADVSKNSRLTDSQRRITREGLSACSTELVPSGSIVVTSRAPVGNVAIADVELCTNQGCKALVPALGVVDPTFGFHVLTTLKGELQSLATGTTFTEISTSRMGEVRVPLPPLPEQAAIVRFLDHVDRRIRRYIRAKQKLIKLLEELKAAIIHRAVTRGLDPNVRLKPSGVEWLGDVPVHWMPNKLRQCGSVVGGMTPSMADRSLWGGDIPWVTPKDMKSFTISAPSMHVTAKALEVTSLRLIPPRSVLLVVRGMILARRVPIAVTTQAVTINQDMKGLVPAEGIDAEFLAYRMEAAQAAFVPLIDEAGHGTKRFPTERWKNIVFALPPAIEQRMIVSYLDQATENLTKALASAKLEIDLLREYRTRLIADVVTGKLDVREAAARLPQEAENLEPLDEAEVEGEAQEADAGDGDGDGMPEEAEA